MNADHINVLRHRLAQIGAMLDDIRRQADAANATRQEIEKTISDHLADCQRAVDSQTPQATHGHQTNARVLPRG